ncbi:vanadium-dependent haloperoxidase [Nonomuraea antimicrobica]
MLRSLFPDQEPRLTAQYDQALTAIPDGRSKQRGIAVGSRTADAMITARENDGAFGDQTWPVGTRPGQWRPTPPTYASDGAWVASLKPFLIPSASMFRTSGPPALTSKRYARDFNEVKTVGAANSTVRTADQTQAAIWWHDRHLAEWEIKRQLVTTQRLNTLRTARMFVMVGMAEADATIACYNEKAAWSFWRPVSAIQLADTDGNPETAADPGWTPLLVTPPHPDYTSGHTCFTGASMSALQHFFGRDDLLQRLQRRLGHHPALPQLLRGDRRGRERPRVGRHPHAHGRRGRRQDRPAGDRLHGHPPLQEKGSLTPERLAGAVTQERSRVNRGADGRAV